jgi:hypothetical protein
MSHRAGVLVVSVVCLALAAGAGPTGSRAGAAPVPKHLMKAAPVYFPTRVGAKWVYLRGEREETHTVTKVEAKEGETVVTVERESDGQMKPYWVVSVRPDGLYLVAETGEPYDPAWQLLKCPVEVGKSWAGKSGRGANLTLEGTLTVDATKKLKVPAGEFEAVQLTWAPKDASSLKYWYAPNVGVVQIGRDPPHLVLKSFTPGKE